MDQKYYVSKEHLKMLINHKEKQLKNGNGFGFKVYSNKDKSGTLMSSSGKNSSTEILILDKSGNIKNKKIASTLSGGGHSGGNHSDMDLIYNFQNPRIRRLTPTECERLQGFPDGYTEGFSDTQRYKTLGNAVTVNVVTSLINKMFKGSEYDRTLK